MKYANETPHQRPLGRVEQGGFAMVVVVVATAIGSLLALASLARGNVEMRSGMGMALSNEAFFAAETGINAELADLPTTQLASLAPLDSLDLGWKQTVGESEYRAVFRRVDDGNGVVQLFTLEVEGRTEGGVAAGRRITSHLVYNDASWKFDAAAKVRGRVRMDSGTSISGRDANPPGWTEERCDDVTLEDAKGLVMQDTIQKSGQGEHNLDGVPALDQDPMIDDATFESSGEIDWGELNDIAGHTIGCQGCGKKRFRPRATTMTDPITGQQVCNTNDPHNFGSQDPDHPCYNYFPVVRIADGGALMEGGDRYAQGIFIVDGAELDIENPMTFAGIILSRGCHEIDDRIFGAIVDDEYPGAHCAASERGMYLDDRTADVNYSQCAVKRALENSALGIYMGTSYDPIALRAFNQMLGS
jgi:hypothetical protein